MIDVVCIHGISDDRRPDWAAQWQSKIVPILDGPDDPVLNFIPIDWEKLHESRYEPARSHRENLLRDLGAIANARIQSYFQGRLAEIAESGNRIWILAHSLGTVLAFQVLDWLQCAGSGLQVEKLVTVGSPLWVPFSRFIRKLTSLNIAMPRAVPLENVACWVNVAGHLDPVAGLGVVPLPTCQLNLTGWARHPFEKYAKTRAFREALRI